MVSASHITRNVAVQVAGRAVTTAVSLVALSLTVRYLGAGEYGVLITVVVFTGLSESFIDLGVGTVIVRRVAAGQAVLERLIGLNLGLSLLYALPLWAATTTMGHLVYRGRTDVQQGIAIVAVGLVFSVLSTCYVPVYEVGVRFGPVALSDVLSRALALVLTVVVVAADLGLVMLFWVQVVPNAVRLVVLFVAARRHGSFRPVWHAGEALGLLRAGMPLAAVTLVGVVYYRADGVLLSLLSDEEQVGAYGLAYRFAGNLGIVGTIFVATVFSSIAARWAVGREQFNDILSRCVEVMLILAVPLAVFGIVLAPSFVALVATDEFVPLASTPLRLLFVATGLAFLNAVAAQSLIAAHAQRYLVGLSVGMLAANIVLNLLLVPAWGATGAGAALVATESASVLGAVHRLHRVSGFAFPAAFAVRLLVPVALCGAVLLAARGAHLLVQLALLVVAYPLALLLTRTVKVADLQELVRPGAEVAAGTEGHAG